MIEISCNKSEDKQNVNIYCSFYPKENHKKSVDATSKTTTVTNLVNYPIMVFLKTATAFVFDLKHENMIIACSIFDSESHESYISKNYAKNGTY